MTRKFIKVLKQKVAEGLAMLLVTIGGLIIFGLYCSIPYLLGKYGISKIPHLEEFSQEECGMLCVIITLLVMGAIIVIVKLSKCVINFMKEQ